MIGKIFFTEIVINGQIFIFIAVFVVLLAIYGAFKLIQLMKKIKRQKKKMHDLVKEYENFLSQRKEK
ncbi:MAG: hypothetical protein HXX18_11055 [Bacteroidetes bacterium]|nr:hypothetical protein [Bacteroidota bacterium]